jgi:hypothetical protein
MPEQQLYRDVRTESSKGQKVITRHITEVVAISDDRDVSLFGPSGETNLRQGDDDEWFIRIEGFAPDRDFTGVWVLDDAPIESTRSAPTRVAANGILELNGRVAALTAAGLPPAAATGNQLVYNFGGVASNPITYLP